jgi:AcrR family transcriptional regulator
VARPVGRRGETRERILEVSLELFAEHGVGGTSLQMIADRIGVTKAAVYRQFQAKEDIVLAVVQPALDRMDALVGEAEALTDHRRRLEVTLEGLVDLVLDHRRVVAALYGDPGIGDILHARPAVAETIERLQRLLLGPAATLSRRVAVAMVGGGLTSIGTDPALIDADTPAVRTELLSAARRLLRDQT